MSHPLVSVIVATYNHAPFIEAALSSALEQDYAHLEVIVADDGSTDGTAERILELAKRWPDRLVPIVGGPNVGIVGNCNRALRVRRGTYVAFLSGDDLFVPEKLGKQVAWLEADPARTLCGHDVEAFDDETGEALFLTTDKTPLRSGKGATEMIERGAFFSGLSLMVRSSVIPPYGYDERVGVISDWKLQIDCVLAGGAYGYVDGVLARYRVHRQSISQRSASEESVRRQYLEGYLTTLALIEAAHPELLSSCARARALYLFSEARWRAWRGEVASARRYYIAATRLSPALAWKTIAGVAFTFMPGSIQNTIQRLLGDTSTASDTAPARDQS